MEANVKYSKIEVLDSEIAVMIWLDVSLIHNIMPITESLLELAESASEINAGLILSFHELKMIMRAKVLRETNGNGQLCYAETGTVT